MNKKLKYGLIFIGTLAGAYAVIKLIKGKGATASSPDEVIAPDGVGYTPKALSLDRNKVLKVGVMNSPEVKSLQRILGFSGGDVDGDFGPKTLAALKAQAGVADTTLAKVEMQIASLAASTSAKQKVTAVKSQFPIGKSAVAAITFRASAYIFRNSDWYSTDADGNALPSKEYKASSDVGKIADYKTSDPNIVIVKVTKPFGGSSTLGYQTTKDYEYIGVKSTWIK